jgi:uncharacterized protein YbaP (TraB family)
VRSERWIAVLCLAVLATAFALLGCAGIGRDRAEADAANAGATPLFWLARAPGGGELYLLGSVHVRVIDAPELGPEIQQAYARSDALVVEVDITRVTPEQGKAAAERYAELPPQLTLDAVISPETRELVARYVESRGLPADQIQRYKPWFVAQLILVTELQAAGYDADLGVDRAFIDQASGVKAIVGLETIDSQLAMLDGPALELQDLMLKDSLLRIDDLEKTTEKLLAAWSRGDETELERQIFRPLEQVPELEAYYDALIWQRNASMAARLVELAADGKTRFVVLGAGHMVGARGIPSRLAEQGFAVERIRPGSASGSPDAAATTRP